MAMQTKEQQRSQFALDMMNQHYPKGVEEPDANFIVGVPTMILTNGLAQTLAFLLSKKGSSKHEVTFSIIKAWLEREVEPLKAKTNMAFLQNFAELDQSNYLTAQREALAMLHWLKRYARAFEV
jgi:CRISPR-associated protein Cmr5